MGRASFGKRLFRVAPFAPLALALGIAVVPSVARADDPHGAPHTFNSADVPVETHADAFGAHHTFSTGVIATWGNPHAFEESASAPRGMPITRARELIAHARFLDDAATADERAANELMSKLAALRSSAKAAREKFARSKSPDEREMLGARAEDLETDVIVSEAEIALKRRTAAENRRVAKDLRARAVLLVRDAPVIEEPLAFASCDPPFRFTADGRKVYRLECLK